MEQRLSVVTLGVADLQRAKRFYAEGLGWTVGQVSDEIVFFQLNGMVLALFPRGELARDAQVSQQGEGFRGVTLAYCTRTRDEVDRVIEQAESVGARVVKKPQDVFWGGYSGYFADPDGHLWEVAHNPFWTLDVQGNVSLDKP